MGVKKMVILMFAAAVFVLLSGFILTLGWRIRKQKKEQEYEVVNFEFTIAVVASIRLIAVLILAVKLVEEARLLAYMFLGSQTLTAVLIFLLFVDIFAIKEKDK